MKEIEICIQSEVTVSRTLCKTLLLLIPLIAPIFHGLNYTFTCRSLLRLVAPEPAVQSKGEYVYSCSSRPRVLQLAGAVLPRKDCSERLIVVAHHVVMLSQVN